METASGPAVFVRGRVSVWISAHLPEALPGAYQPQTQKRKRKCESWSSDTAGPAKASLAAQLKVQEGE